MAPPAETGPVVILLGFSLSGESWFEALIEGAGHPARIWSGGRLARDLAYSAATGQRPFAGQPRARLFGRIECVHQQHLPRIVGPIYLEHLRKTWPEAAFVLNHLPVEAWLARRRRALDGDYLRQDCYHLGLGPEGVMAQWRAEYSAHLGRARRIFADHPRFIDCLATEEGLAGAAAQLGRWMRLGPVPRYDPEADLEARGVLAPRQSAGLALPLPAPARAPAAPPDTALCDEVARFSLKTCADAPPGADHLTGTAIWDGATSLRRVGRLILPLAPQPVVPEMPPQPPGVLTPPMRHPEARLQAMVNELLSLGRRGRVAIDMRDARPRPKTPDEVPPEPVLSYNRRPGAPNRVLWPLPGYHTPGLASFVHPGPVDPVPFAEKDDAVLWRGALTGGSCPALLPEGEAPRPLKQILAQIDRRHRLGRPLGPALRHLKAVPRYHLVSHWGARPDFDVGLVAGPGYGHPFTAPLLTDFARPAKPLAWFHRARYLLSVSGYDTGSNFLWACQTNAVVLREEDGWELFYTPLFRPWEHYIPLARGLTDLDAQLDWARRNPARCEEISRAATEMCLGLADPANRRAMLGMIADGIGLSGPGAG